MIENMPSPPDRPATPAATRPDLLLERVAEGDREAFSQLYDLMAARVLGLIRRLLVDPAQSEEVAQEVFLGVADGRGSTPPEGTRRAGCSHSRTGGPSTGCGHRRPPATATPGSVSVNSRIEFDEVSETVEARDEHRRITSALARLTELQRQAILLAYYGGYSHREVAEKLAVPIGTVKTRLRDGMIRLRDELGVTS